MKSKLFLIAAASACTLSLHACPEPSGQTLSQQYEAGALQWKLARKEIDPSTLIHQAILESSIEVIRFLLAHGVDVNYPDKNGMTPLTMALVNGNTYAVKVLLKNGANAKPQNKWNGMSLLEIAVFMHDRTAAILLVDHGADVNCIDQKKVGVLSKVIRIGWDDVAKKMIEKGANVHACEWFHEDDNAPLFDAIRFAAMGDDSLLRIFIEKGVNLNMMRPAKRSCGGSFCDTPLLAAISCDSLEVVKLLVESGADPRKGIHLGREGDRSPIAYAIERGQPRIVQYLLQHGAAG